MQSPAQFYAWFACVFCVTFTLRSAFAFSQKKADIFLALCVYAGQFATLIVYYSGFPQPNDLLPAISGYFAAIAGFLVVRTHHRGSPEEHSVRSSEEAVVWLLLLIALPRFLVSPFGRGLFPRLDEHAVEVLVTLALDTIGYYALYRAVAVSQRAVVRRRLLSAPLVLYWVLNATFSCIQLYHLLWLGSPFAMPVIFLYSFAVIKIITVLTFVPAVLAHDFFKYKWPKRLMIFLHLAAVD